VATFVSLIRPPPPPPPPLPRPASLYRSDVLIVRYHSVLGRRGERERKREREREPLFTDERRRPAAAGGIARSCV